jgi:2-C-methyl-D-erythritol 4-phosphate cytidylyltransferase
VAAVRRLSPVAPDRVDARAVSRPMDPVSAPRLAAIVLAAGSGIRLGAGRNKAFLPLAGKTIVARSLATMASLTNLRRLVLVIRPDDQELARATVNQELHRLPVHVELVTGGNSRHASEERALNHLAVPIEAREVDVVLIHDAARPLCTTELATQVASAAAHRGGAVPGIPAQDLMHVGTDGTATAVAASCVTVQTPQGFAAIPLLEAYRAAAEAGFVGSDTSACIERFTRLNVQCLPGEPENIKITHPTDLYLAEQLLLNTEAKSRL